MKIAFDAKRAFTNRSGLGIYSRNLISSAMEFHPEHEYTLFSSKETSLFDRKSSAVITRNSRLSWYFRSFGITSLLNSKSIDVYHGLSNELPLNIASFGGKKIVTIHDVLFRKFPSYYPPIDRYFYDMKTRRACKDADVVICISDYTKRDLLQHYKVDENKIRVMYQPVSSRFFSPAVDHKRETDLKKRFDLDKEYLLYVGTIEERKDLLSIIKALKRIAEKDVMLYVVGRKKQPYFAKVHAYLTRENLSERVKFLENVEDDELPAIYRSAAMLIYPSHSEGWGLPVAEGICSGIPVITTRNTSMEEIGGDACVYFNAGNYHELAEQIDLVLKDASLKKELISRSKDRALLLDPRSCSDRMNELYLSK
jgi:glycosyltransferase involved in cell wall biosynthesis